MKLLKFKLTGRSPLIMHSDQGVDTTNPLAKKSKKISSKRNKTEEDHIEMMCLDWMLGLYYDEKDGPVIPGANVERALTDAAKMQKLGQHFKRGLRIPSMHSKLEYKGPRDRDELMNTKNWDTFRIVKPMKVGTSKIIRCRPYFKDWSIVVELAIDENIIDEDQVENVFENCGKYIGLCDSRPKYGSFDVAKVS